MEQSPSALTSYFCVQLVKKLLHSVGAKFYYPVDNRHTRARMKLRNHED
jgi:hypothetical protein